LWRQRYYSILSDFRFLPGGRILAGAGTGYDVTLFNCFVMGRIDDSMEGICDSLKEGTLTMQQGGGVGYDFSTLRPAGSLARRVGSMASGPVSFMRVWDSMCATLVSSAYRRGAMMATLRCDHPDIEQFIDAKRDPRELRNFNLSVLVSDDFMQAVQDDLPWPLVFPERAFGDPPRSEGREVIQRRSGKSARASCGSASCAPPTIWPNPGCFSSTVSTSKITCITAKTSAPPIPAVKFRCHPMAPVTWVRLT
jgi:ribonucleoside-diphosphate reductase alpha chain